MNIPAQLRYSPQHLWIAPQADGSVLAGITDHAQATLGDIVFVEGPGAGTQLEQGQACGVIESVKTASDLHAPLDGVVLEVNQDVLAAPESINASPYDAWIFRLQPESPQAAAALLDADSYRALLD